MKKNILVICVSLPFLLGGTYYSYQKYNTSRLQACERAKERFVERLKIHNAIQAKKTEYQTESIKKRIEDGTWEAVNSTVDSTVKGTLRYGYNASNSEVNSNNPCAWVRYYHRSMKNPPLGSGSY